MGAAAAGSVGGLRCRFVRGQRQGLHTRGQPNRRPSKRRRGSPRRRRFGELRGDQPRPIVRANCSRADVNSSSTVGHDLTLLDAANGSGEGKASTIHDGKGRQKAETSCGTPRALVDTMSASTAAMDETLGNDSRQARDVESQLARTPVPILTILYHPDLSRVGERSWLNDPGSRDGIRLSRIYPAFGRPGGDTHFPLADLHLSRKPHTMRISSQGEVSLVVSPHGNLVRIDGELVRGQQRFSPERLASGVVITLEERVVLLLHHTLPEHVAESEPLGLVGDSWQMAEVREQIRRVADHDVPVLVRGESGTGKELVATALHGAGGRSGGRLVSVNMAALVPSTAAAALFGHTQGAFTGANRASGGYFGEADGGTLFLDEVGETPSEVQPALLRALENGEVQPLGAAGSLERDVRLVTATDCDLEDAVSKGRFRLPLLQRLAGYEIFLPRLRDRRCDIAPLLLHFLRDYTRRRDLDHLLERVEQPWLPAALVTAATLAPWRGNVRELKNFARRLVIDWGDANQIGPRAQLNLSDEVEASPPSEPVPSSRPGPPSRRSLSEISDAELTDALARNDHRPGRTARDLGVSRTSLYALINKSKSVRKAADLEADEIAQVLHASSGDMVEAARRLKVSKRGLTLRMRQLQLGDA